MRDGSPTRHPAVAMALALAAGIVCDHFWPATLRFWLLAAAGLMLARVWLVRYPLARESAAESDGL